MASKEDKIEAKKQREFTEQFDRCVMWHEMVGGIKWRYVRHWAQSYLAGEGLRGSYDSVGKFLDGSGGIVDERSGVFPGRTLAQCMVPKVMIAKEFIKDDRHISAFLSYPNGMSTWQEYHWEIYPADAEGNEKRFDTEQEMEDHIISILAPELFAVSRKVPKSIIPTVKAMDAKRGDGAWLRKVHRGK